MEYFRESVITKAMAYGSFPAQKKLVEKYKALLRAKGVAGEDGSHLPGFSHAWEICALQEQLLFEILQIA